MGWTRPLETQMGGGVSSGSVGVLRPLFKNYSSGNIAVPMADISRTPGMRGVEVLCLDAIALKSESKESRWCHRYRLGTV